MNVLTPFPDISKVILALLDRDVAVLADGTHSGLALPVGFETNLPFVRPGKIGGGRRRLQDDPVLDIDTWHTGRTAALSLAEAISAHLLGYPFTIEVGGRFVVLDGIEETSSPAEVPWDDSITERFTSTYRISVRR